MVSGDGTKETLPGGAPTIEGMGTQVGEQTWQAHLRARGYRLTHQRQSILEAVTELRHATPDDILNHIRETEAGINISTVYRTLEVLEELGLVTHAHLSHGAPTYHSAGETAHVHLVCSTCDAVSEAEPTVADELVRRLEKDRGFTVDLSHFVVAGTCTNCQRR